MASRRFIQKFDRLNADAQHHIEQQIDLLLELGYVRGPADTVTLQAVSKVIPFASRPVDTVRRLFMSQHLVDHASVLERTMLKASLAADLAKTFGGIVGQSRLLGKPG